MAASYLLGNKEQMYCMRGTYKQQVYKKRKTNFKFK